MGGISGSLSGSDLTGDHLSRSDGYLLYRGCIMVDSGLAVILDPIDHGITSCDQLITLLDAYPGWGCWWPTVITSCDHLLVSTKPKDSSRSIIIAVVSSWCCACALWNAEVLVSTTATTSSISMSTSLCIVYLLGLSLLTA